jgi:hypothetical protein
MFLISLFEILLIVIYGHGFIDRGVNSSSFHVMVVVRFEM